MLKKILLLLASPVLALTIRANTVALDFTGGTLIGLGNANVGWAFSLSSAVLVTDLGTWDEGSNGLLKRVRSPFGRTLP